MTYNEIITLALSNTHTKTGQVGSDLLKTAFNISRNTIANAIIKDVDENYFFQFWTRDAVADQNNGEYPYPKATSDSAGMLKCLKLYIKGLSTDTYFTDADEVDIKTLSRDWSWYLENQPKSKPIYFIADESFFVAPQFSTSDLPDEPSGNQQIKLGGIAKMTDLDVGAEESAILIPTDSHWRIALGMEQFIYKARKLKQEAFDSKQEFEVEIAKMIDELTNRDNSKMTGRLPSDYNLGFGQ